MKKSRAQQILSSSSPLSEPMPPWPLSRPSLRSASSIASTGTTVRSARSKSSRMHCFLVATAFAAFSAAADRPPSTVGAAPFLARGHSNNSRSGPDDEHLLPHRRLDSKSDKSSKKSKSSGHSKSSKHSKSSENGNVMEMEMASVSGVKHTNPRTEEEYEQTDKQKLAIILSNKGATTESTTPGPFASNVERDGEVVSLSEQAQVGGGSSSSDGSVGGGKHTNLGRTNEEHEQDAGLETPGAESDGFFSSTAASGGVGVSVQVQNSSKSGKSSKSSKSSESKSYSQSSASIQSRSKSGKSSKSGSVSSKSSKAGFFLSTSSNGRSGDGSKNDKSSKNLKSSKMHDLSFLDYFWSLDSFLSMSYIAIIDVNNGNGSKSGKGTKSSKAHITNSGSGSKSDKGSKSSKAFIANNGSGSKSDKGSKSSKAFIANNGIGSKSGKGSKSKSSKGFLSGNVDGNSEGMATRAPTEVPTTDSSEGPTPYPSGTPSFSPISPTRARPRPTIDPTKAPAHSPTLKPTSSPTEAPTYSPTLSPTTSPTGAPTHSPTLVPTSSPIETPTTAQPTPGNEVSNPPSIEGEEVGASNLTAPCGGGGEVALDPATGAYGATSSLQTQIRFKYEMARDIRTSDDVSAGIMPALESALIEAVAGSLILPCGEEDQAPRSRKRRHMLEWEERPPSSIVGISSLPVDEIVVGEECQNSELNANAECYVIDGRIIAYLRQEADVISAEDETKRVIRTAMEGNALASSHPAILEVTYVGDFDDDEKYASAGSSGAGNDEIRVVKGDAVVYTAVGCSLVVVVAAAIMLFFFRKSRREDDDKRGDAEDTHIQEATIPDTIDRTRTDDTSVGSRQLWEI